LNFCFSLTQTFLDNSKMKFVGVSNVSESSFYNRGQLNPTLYAFAY
jgi:hypothetical protein